jgi:hypothetical protein
MKIGITLPQFGDNKMENNTKVFLYIKDLLMF